MNNQIKRGFEILSVSQEVGNQFWNVHFSFSAYYVENESIDI